MIKTILESEEKRMRVGDNLEETKPATARDEDLQKPIVEVSGPSDTDGA